MRTRFFSVAMVSVIFIVSMLFTGFAIADDDVKKKKSRKITFASCDIDKDGFLTEDEFNSCVAKLSEKKRKDKKSERDKKRKEKKTGRDSKRNDKKDQLTEDAQEATTEKPAEVTKTE